MALLLVLLLAALDASTAAVLESGVQIPTYTEPCRRNSDDFDSCLQKALQELIPKLGKSGITELELGPIDPWEIPQVVFNYDALADIGGNLELSNAITRGISSVNITAVRSKIVEGKSFALDIDFKMREVVTSGSFKMEGRVGVFPIKGSGPFNLTSANTTGTWKLRGSPVEVRGQEYIRLDYFGLRPSVSYMKLHADNIVDGRPEITRLIVAFTNRFWQLLYAQTLPNFEKNLDVLGRDLLNKIFLKIPYDQLFPKV